MVGYNAVGLQMPLDHYTAAVSVVSRKLFSPRFVESTIVSRQTVDILSVNSGMHDKCTDTYLEFIIKECKVGRYDKLSCFFNGVDPSSIEAAYFTNSKAEQKRRMMAATANGVNTCFKLMLDVTSVSEYVLNNLRQVSWCVTVVVVSDDLTFLATFAQWSLKGRLLVWSTRLLVVTRLPLHHLHHLHTLLSNTNSMLIIYEESLQSIRCGVYLQVPYSPLGAHALRVASWTPQRGLALTSRLPFFPDKFSRFLERPVLVAVTEVNPLNKLITEAVASCHGGHLDAFSGPVPKLMDFLASALNFSFTYARPPDGSWGFKHEDGSWTGMVGMVERREADIGVGPFGVSATRAEAVDFTGPILIDYWRILGGRGRPEVDPWSFALPLEPSVWAATLAALLGIPALMWLVSSCLAIRSGQEWNWLNDTFSFIRVVLQQDLPLPQGWWWERELVVLWMLVTLVLTRSYSGNLMALLAVMHVPQPFQSLQDVLDHSSVITIWETESASVQYLHSVESGIFRDIANLEKKGRVVYRTQSQFEETIDTLVRSGHHVLMEVDMSIKAYVAQDFTRTGKCSFYESREEFLPLMFALIGQKNSPLVPALSRRIMTVAEAGLFSHWMKEDEPNSTVCYRAPSKITVQSSLSIKNLWGMFVVFSIGICLSLLVLCLEIVTHYTSNVKK
nr:probable glutamate receptor [Procambarus clarkii]